MLQGTSSFPKQRKGKLLIEKKILTSSSAYWSRRSIDAMDCLGWLMLMDAALTNDGSKWWGIWRNGLTHHLQDQEKFWVFFVWWLCISFQILAILGVSAFNFGGVTPPWSLAVRPSKEVVSFKVRVLSFSFEDSRRIVKVWGLYSTDGLGWWFRSRWFGILRVSQSNDPFHKGIP